MIGATALTCLSWCINIGDAYARHNGHVRRNKVLASRRALSTMRRAYSLPPQCCVKSGIHGLR
jgi:hypothetical protein